MAMSQYWRGVEFNVPRTARQAFEEGALAVGFNGKLAWAVDEEGNPLKDAPEIDDELVYKFYPTYTECLVNVGPGVLYETTDDLLGRYCACTPKDMVTITLREAPD